MKKNTFIYFIFFIFSFSFLISQREKKIIQIACVDVQKIMNEISKDSILRKILNKNQSDFLNEAETLAREINRLKSIIEQEGDNLPNAKIEAIRADILTKEIKLKEYLDGRSSFLRKKESIYSEDILRNIYRYIKQVAEKEGYSLILEKTTAVVYADDKVDITPLILKLMAKEKKKYQTD